MMYRALLVSAVALFGYAIGAAAQRTCRMWSGKTMVGPKDSVVATYVLEANTAAKGWTLKFPGREPIATRILARGGDSMVTETGPYNSVLRPGEMVTTRTTGHVHGKKMIGTFEANYASGDVLKGKIAATCKKS